MESISGKLRIFSPIVYQYLWVDVYVTEHVWWTYKDLDRVRWQYCASNSTLGLTCNSRSCRLIGIPMSPIDEPIYFMKLKYWAIFFSCAISFLHSLPIFKSNVRSFWPSALSIQLSESWSLIIISFYIFIYKKKKWKEFGFSCLWVIINENISQFSEIMKYWKIWQQRNVAIYEANLPDYAFWNSHAISIFTKTANFL